MDALFLSAAVAEAREALQGGHIVSVVPEGPEAMRIGVDGPRGRSFLCLGWEAWGPRWHVCSEGAAAAGEGAFAAAAGRALRGGRIVAVVRPGLERAAGLAVERRRGPALRRLALWAYLWPTARNVVLVDADEGIIAAARPGPWQPGGAFSPPEAKPGSLLALALEGAGVLEPRLRSSLVDTPPEETAGDEPGGVERALARAVPGLGLILAREAVFRGRRGGPGAPADPVALSQALAEVMAVVRQERFAPRIILGADGEPRGLAAIPLSCVPEELQRPYPSAGAAAEAFFARRRAAAAQGAARAQAERALRHLRARITQRIVKLKAELAEHQQAMACRQWGEILVAHQRQVSRGAHEAVLPDPYGPPGATRSIPLDPARSAAANAERYFKRARRGARGEPLAAARLAAAQRELDRVAELEKTLAAATTPEAFREICAAARRLRAGGRGPGAGGRGAGRGVQSQPPTRHTDGGRGPNPRPATVAAGKPRRVGRGRASEVARLARRFVSADGLPILVGRDNTKNDELTLHVARPDDLWLHVEGYGGSHVVIRREGRADVPRRTLFEAAQLAAYYSQARGQRKVPVHYTLRKYVRKPKGAKPGLVTITHEKTVFATPDPEVVRRLAAPQMTNDQ